jgi:Fe-S-cluster-containing hydrogenase component 2
VVALGFGGTNPDGTPKAIANKCDLCPNEERGPSCVRVCPTECLRLVKEDDLSGILKSKRLSAVNTAAQAAQAAQTART